MEQIPKRLQEILIKGRTDPVLFAHELLGMELHQGQVTYLTETNSRGTRVNVLSCANRWGKSVTIACLQLWYLFYKFGVPTGNREAWMRTEYITSNLAPQSSLTEPVFKTIDQILTSRFPIRENGKLRTNKCQIEWFYLQDRTLNTPPYKQFFAFNTMIEHRSLAGDMGDSFQGRPYGIITYDEAARSNHLAEEISDSIKGRLADWGAPLHLLSTPSQSSPSNLHYYQLYQEGLVGLNNSYTQEGDLSQNTFFTPKQIAAQVLLFEGDPLAAQALAGKFIFGGDTIFEPNSIINAQDKDLDPGIRYEDGHKYVMGIDTAIGSDEMVYTVLDTTEKPFKLVRMMACKGNSKSPQFHLNDLLDLIDSYWHEGNLNIILETWNGESVRFYHDLPDWVKSVTKCYGSWSPAKVHADNRNPMRPRTGDVKKADILIALKKLLSSGELKIPQDQKLVQQLQIYKEKDDKIPTDRVMALALAAYHASELIPQEVAWVPTEW